VPKDNQILVRIRATTVTAGDCEVRRSDVPLFLRLGIRLMMGIRRPRNPLGMEMAGVVEAHRYVGKGHKKGIVVITVVDGG
jgi:NADPH:quinone reductase-like Zn-dependent oxidoreductase